MKVKVENMISDKSNKAIANQFLITIPGGYIFQSYKTVIASFINGNITLDNEAENYSRTTSKYLWQFLKENAYNKVSQYKNLKDYIKNGYYERKEMN